MRYMVLVLVCLGILGAALLLEPGEEGLRIAGFSWPLYCTLHRVVGVKCALCGMTRSFCVLAHGDISRAFGFHLLGPVVFLFVCFQLVYGACGLGAGSVRVNAGLARFNTRFGLAILGALVVNWIIYLGGLLL